MFYRGTETGADWIPHDPRKQQKTVAHSDGKTIKLENKSSERRVGGTEWKGRKCHNLHSNNQLSVLVVRDVLSFTRSTISIVIIWPWKTTFNQCFNSYLWAALRPNLQTSLNPHFGRPKLSGTALYWVCDY